MKIVELFAGSRSIGKAESPEWNFFKLIGKNENINFAIDIAPNENKPMLPDFFGLRLILTALQLEHRNSIEPFIAIKCDSEPTLYKSD